MVEDLAEKERIHQADEPLKKDTHIREMFFATDKPAERIFLKGEAGSGKTLFCIKLLDAWCRIKQSDVNNRDEFEHCMSVFDFVYYIPMRDVAEGMTCVKDIVEKYGPCSSQGKLGDSEFKCLVILDGLDEWPSTKENVKLPNMNGLMNCVLLCTMRPWAMLQLKLKFKSDDKVIQLVGLDPNNIDTLIKQVLANFYRLKADTDEFNSKFSRYLLIIKKSEVGSLVEIPMMLTTFCCMLYENDSHGEKKNPQNYQMSNYSITYSYLYLMEAMVRRADEKYDLKSMLKREKQTMLSKLLSRLAILYQRPSEILRQFTYINQYSDTLLSLCRLAYNDLVSRKQGTPKDTIQEIEKAIGHTIMCVALKLGLISQSKEPGRFLEQNVSINFYHKTFQEFMAALHIVCGSLGMVSSFNNLLSSLSKILEHVNIIRFIIGLNPSDGCQISRIVANTMNEDSKIKRYRCTLLECKGLIKTIFKAQCRWYSEIKESLKTGLQSSFKFLVTDIFLDQDSDSDAVSIAGELMFRNKTDIVSITMWNVQYPLNDVLEHARICTNLSALCINIANKDDHDQVVTELSHLSCLDTIVYYGNCNLRASDHAAAVMVIRHLRRLKRLVLKNVDLGDISLMLTRKMTRLETLELNSVNMSGDSWDLSVNDLLRFQHPVRVLLWGTNIDDDTVSMIQTSQHFTVTIDDKEDTHDKHVINNSLDFSTVGQQKVKEYDIPLIPLRGLY